MRFSGGARLRLSPHETVGLSVALSKFKTEDLPSVLLRSPWYAGLDAETQRRIETGGRLRSVRRGEVIVNQGDEVTGLYALIDGQTRAQTAAINGKPALLGVLHPGDFFAFLACADGRPHSVDIVASIESQIFHLPIPTVREIFHAEQKLFMHLVDPQLISMRRITEYLTSAIRLSPIERLAERLLEFSRSPYYPEGEFRSLLGLSQELLASAVLCTRQTANELLGELEARKLIRSEYGQIDILDPVGLKKIFQPN